MNEITHIHLGRQPFSISVEAHKALKAYLDAIAKEVGRRRQDVVDEVEARMAELLSERGLGEKKVVIMEDVTYLKDQLGEPRDFKDDDDTDDEPTEQQTSDGSAPRRLFRDTQTGMLAGVASGLAAYFNIDPIITRLLFVVLTLTGGAGIVLYLLLWVLVPEAKTGSNRLQMQGKPVTVDSIKKIVENADVPGAAYRASRLIEKIFLLAVRILASIFGIVFLLAGVAAFLGTTAMGVYMLVHGGQVNDIVIFPVGAQEVGVLICAMLAALALAVLLFCMGVSMIRRKFPVPGWVAASLVAVFFLSGSVGAALATDAAPGIAKRVDALNQVHTKQMPAFSKVVLNGKDTIFWYQPSSAYSVELSYLGKSYVDPINAKVENGVLTIDTIGFANDACKFLCFYNDGSQRVVIRAPQMPEFMVGNGGDGVQLNINSVVAQKELRITALKSVNVTLVGNAKQLAITDSPSSAIRTFVLTDVTPQDAYNNQLNADLRSVYIHNYGNVSLDTGGASCEGHNPLLYVGTGKTPQVQVNGAPISLTQGDDAARNYDTLSAANCVQASL